MTKTIENNTADTVKGLDLVEHMQLWIKPKQDPEFWEATKRLNLMLALADIPDQDKSRMAHDIVIAVRLSQLAAFHDGLRKGRQEAAQRIAVECKRIR